jgi:hypothetical protein
VRSSVARQLAREASEEPRHVLVCTGLDLTPEQRTQSIDHLAQMFRDIGFAQPRVDVLSQNQLITSLAPFPSQCLALNGRDGARFQELEELVAKRPDATAVRD